MQLALRANSAPKQPLRRTSMLLIAPIVARPMIQRATKLYSRCDTATTQSTKASSGRLATWPSPALAPYILSRWLHRCLKTTLQTQLGMELRQTRLQVVIAQIVVVIKLTPMGPSRTQQMETQLIFRIILKTEAEPMALRRPFTSILRPKTQQDLK